MNASNPRSDGTDSPTLALTRTVTGVPRTFFAPAAFVSLVQVATTSATVGAATNDARRIVCEETQDLPGFTPGAGGVIDTCTSPTTFVATYTVSSVQVGASAEHPIGTAHIRCTLNFSTLLPYPFLPHGTWTMTTNSTYAVIRGR